MKLHLNQSDRNNQVTAYGDDFIAINHQHFHHHVMVSANQIVENWFKGSWTDLDETAFQALIAHQPEVVLLGTGKQHRFVHPKLIRALTEANIPVECMSTAAACRTYNILMSEGRQVLAAFILD